MVKNHAPPQLTKDQIIGSYRLVRHIGSGGFASVWAAEDTVTGEICCMKVEKDGSNAGLCKEVSVLTQLQHSTCFPQLIDAGVEGELRWMTEELLGPSLAVLRRKRPNGKFSLRTAVSISLSMLRCIEETHRAGLVHRDVKPHNFVLAHAGRVVLIDFGLARRYADWEGLVKLPRDQPGFAGTRKYASPRALMGMEQGRGDDLIGWFYSMVQFAKGSLPWDGVAAKQIAKKQRACTAEQLCAGLPPVFLDIWRKIVVLEYEEEPDYDEIAAMLQEFSCEVTDIDLMSGKLLRQFSLREIRRGRPDEVWVEEEEDSEEAARTLA